MIEPDIRAEIMRRLAAAEVEHNMKILYCCESGSRAWGFPSPDSDYDVRFIYARPRDWYLSFDVESRRDVIEYPIVDEIDCGGWDIKKALYLFTRTNGALLEWLRSPICYIDEGGFANALRELVDVASNRTALCYHYSHMARGNAREHIFHDQVKLKKYLYVLRPLLAIRYIEEGNGVPPVEFSKLVDSMAPEDLKPHIDALLEKKKNTPELGKGEKIPAINHFIETELARHDDAFTGQGRPALDNKNELYDKLNAIYRSVISGVS